MISIIPHSCYNETLASPPPLLVGIIALAVLIRYQNQEIPKGAVKLVFTVGIADFVSSFFFGYTSAATPFQLFAFDLPNQVSLYPTGLIPLFLDRPSPSAALRRAAVRRAVRGQR